MAFDVKKTSIEITAVDKTKVAFDSVKSSIGGLSSQFGALSGILSAGAFVAFTKRIIDQADSMNDLSKRTGIAVGQIGAWKLATEQSGTSIEALTQALGKGSKYLVEHGDNLKKIGINAKTSEELILQLSGVISKMPSDDPRRTALAMQVLGKSAGELIPLLSEGEAGLRAMLERGRELNPVTQEMAAEADKFNDILAEMKLQASGLGFAITRDLLPGLNTFLLKMREAAENGNLLTGFFGATVDGMKTIRERVVARERINKEIPDRMKFLSGSLLNKSITDTDRYRIGIELKALANEKNNLMRELGMIKKEAEPVLELNKNQNSALNSFLNPESETKARKLADDAKKAARDKLMTEEKLYEVNRDMFRELDKRQIKHDELVRKNQEELANDKLETQRKWFELEERNMAKIQQEREAELERLAEQQQEMAHEFSQALTNGLFDSFKKGESFGRAMLSNLMALAKTWAVRLLDGILAPIGSSIAAVFTGGAASVFSGSASAAASGGSSSIFGGFASIGDAIMKGNAGIISGIESLGTFLSTGNGGLGDLLGGALGQYASQIANVLPFAGAAFSLLTGDIKGAISQGVGAGIGLAIGGPVGGIVGAVAGSLLGGLGGEHVIRKKFYANASVGSSGTNILSAYGNSDTSGSEKRYAAGPANSFADAIMQYAKAFGASVDRFTLGVTYHQKYNAYGINVGREITKSGWDFVATADKSVDGAAQAFLLAVKKGFVNLPDYILNILNKSILNISDAQANIQLIADIKKIGDALKDLPPIFDAIGYSLEKNVTLNNVNLLKSQFAAVGTFTSLFYTQQEQFDTFTRQLTSQFDALNTAVPKSRDEYRKLVDGIKVTDESTSNLFHGLVALAPAMDSYFKQLQAQADVLNSITRSTDSFATLADFRNYTGISGNFGTTFSADYTSNLEAGRISYTANGQARGAGANADLINEVKMLRTAIEANVVYSSQTASVLRKFDGDGMPEVRVIA